MVSQMVQPLNQRTIKKAITNMQLQVQAGKVSASKTTIRKLQSAERFPVDYLSYHSSIAAKNKYSDHEKFFRVMKSQPKLWRRKFFYISERLGSQRIGEAAIYARQMAERKASQFGRKTGFYESSFRQFINLVPFTNPARLISITDDDVYTLTNEAAYASTSEVNALYYARTGGILFYTAKMVQRKFPELGVSFYYMKAPIGVNHRYDLPVIEIGSPSVVKSIFSRPGRRIKKRGRLARKAARINARFS